MQLTLLLNLSIMLSEFPTLFHTISLHCPLQSAQNAASKVIFPAKHPDNFSHTHTLELCSPLCYPIQFKLLATVFRALHSSAPPPCQASFCSTSSALLMVTILILYLSASCVIISVASSTLPPCMKNPSPELICKALPSQHTVSQLLCCL